MLCIANHHCFLCDIYVSISTNWALWIAVNIFCNLCEKSGLTQKSRESQTSVTNAESELLEFVKRYSPPSTCPLAGNSVHVDKLFLARYMPDFVQHLHYRIVDVSTVKELCRWGLLIMYTEYADTSGIMNYTSLCLINSDKTECLLSSRFLGIFYSCANWHDYFYTTNLQQI